MELQGLTHLLKISSTMCDSSLKTYIGVQSPTGVLHIRVFSIYRSPGRLYNSPHLFPAGEWVTTVVKSCISVMINVCLQAKADKKRNESEESVVTP